MAEATLTSFLSFASLQGHSWFPMWCFLYAVGSLFFPGNSSGTVYEWRWHYMLEESVPYLKVRAELIRTWKSTWVLSGYEGQLFFNKLERDSDHCLFFCSFRHWLCNTGDWGPSLNVYYIIILAWAIFYLSNCFYHRSPGPPVATSGTQVRPPLKALCWSYWASWDWLVCHMSCCEFRFHWKLGVISVPGLHTRMSWALAQGLVQEKNCGSYLVFANIEAVSFGHTVRMQVWSAKLRSRASGCDSSPASECQIFL